MACNEIVIVKTANGEGPIQEIATVGTSLIHYMCNKCNKKYTTNVGLKRHSKFCIDRVPNNQTQKINENSLPIQNMNYPIHCDKSWNSDNLFSINPYEFDDEDNIRNSMENTKVSLSVDIDGDVCECCGENVNTAHQAGELKCNVCNKYYKHKDSFDLHNKRFHSNLVSAIECPLCPVRCEDQSSQFEHMQIHNPTKNFTCSVCNKHFTRKYHLDRHLEQTGCDGREKAKFSCQVCERIFKRKDNLKEHLRQHIDNRITKKLYICDFCNKKFQGRRSFINHIKKHTGSSVFSCSYCKKTVKTKGSLKKHERIHTGERPFSCDKCGKSFAAQEVLSRHIKTHLKIKPIACYECGETFIQASQLRSHMFYHNNDNGFKCDTCNKSFSKKSILLTHQRYKHEGAEKIKCNFDGCSKTFSTKDSLKRHEKIHNGEKPYPCSTCGKFFRSKTNKTAHERIHKRETPRVCTHCPRAFIRADCFLRHMRSKHPEDYKALVIITRKNKLESMKQQLKNYKEECNQKKSPTSALNSESNYDICFSFENVKSREFSNIQLVSNIEELISLLIDKECLDAFKWPSISVDEVLRKVIRNCGGQPVVSSKMSRFDKLRENTKLLFTVVIDDAAMKKLVDSYSIDEVIMHVLQLGKSM